mmetsp:Transcript_8584/g.18732  ORF Transcript_8584/g.18732 Transcript_8584/m.18732 type:complete len:151 (+) Transcript_8584:301-753(+)
METVASVCHESQLLAQQQHALLACIDHLHEARDANVCPAPPVQDTIPDNISALTDILGRFAALSMAATATSPTTSSTLQSTPPSTCQCNHNPTSQGRFYGSYCWKCGCNCTHWTRKCNFLTPAERAKYQGADFDNRMDGSTKFLDRQRRY